MFGIGAQELVVIVFLVLIVFGPGKVGSIAKDIGRWAYEARRSVEEFKEELNAKEEPEEEQQRPEDVEAAEKPSAKGESEEEEEEQHPPETVEGTEKPSAKPAQEEETLHNKEATAKEATA